MEPQDRVEPGAGARRRRALLAGALPFLLLVVWSPLVATPALTPRVAILLLVGTAGLPALVSELRRHHPAAIAAAAFLAWAMVSAVAANTALAWTGEYPLGTGAVFVAAVVAAWNLARRLDADGRRGLVLGVIAGAILNALVAVVQISFDLGIRELDLVHDRATGLAGNPVFLGAITASAIPLLATRVREHPALCAAGAALLAAATQLSGSRIALVTLAVGIVVLVATVRTQRLLAAAMALAVLVGVVAGGALTMLDDDRAQGATERLASPTEGARGVGQRVEIWKAGLAAAADRPLVGWGPGRFQDGATPHRSLRLARLTNNIFSDAHNLVIEHLATTGVAGLAALSAWMGLAGREAWRRRRGPLLGAALALVLFHAVEPQNVAVTPLFAALLGAAGAPEDGGVPLTRTPRVTAAVLAIPAALAASVLLAGDAWARIGVLDFDPDAAAHASDALPMWAAPVALEARIAVFEHETTDDDAALARAVALTGQAVEREPRDPSMLELRAATLSRAGMSAPATEAWRRVLEVNPWSVQALTALRDTWLRQDEPEAASACRRLLDLLETDDSAAEAVATLRSRCASG